MKNISTQCMDELKHRTDKTQVGRRYMPRKQTLDFLKQFARVYQAEPVMQTEFCGYVLN